MGIFAISWVFWNWKTIYFLAFNEGLPDERITKVINLYGGIGNYLYMPLIITLLYVLGAPILKALALKYDRYIDWRDSKNVYENQLSIYDLQTTVLNRVITEKEMLVNTLTVEFNQYQQSIKEAKETLDTLKLAIKSIEEFTDPNWKSPLEESDNFSISAQNRKIKITELKSKFSAIEELKKRIVNE